MTESYTRPDDRDNELRIHDNADSVLLVIESMITATKRKLCGTYIANEDAPRVALEILLAAGYEPAKYQVAIDQQDPSFAALVLSNAVLKAEEAKSAEALNKRRDELARELTLGAITYTETLDRAIDRIIELESRP